MQAVEQGPAYTIAAKPEDGKADEHAPGCAHAHSQLAAAVFVCLAPAVPLSHCRPLHS